MSEDLNRWHSGDVLMALDAEEQGRIAALNASIAYWTSGTPSGQRADMQDVIDTAKAFETFIISGEMPAAPLRPGRMGVAWNVKN